MCGESPKATSIEKSLILIEYYIFSRVNVVTCADTNQKKQTMLKKLLFLMIAVAATLSTQAQTVDEIIANY